MGGFQSRLCRLEYLCSQAILQAASWPSPSFHKYTGGPTRYHAENHFYPLKAGAWAHALCNHPDQLFVAVLLDGVQRPELILGGGRHFSPPGLVLLFSSFWFCVWLTSIYSQMLLVPGAVVPCLAHSGFNPLPPQSVLTTPAVRELFPVVLACAVWGKGWAGQHH